VTAVPVDIDRLSADLDRLAAISDAPAPAVTRVLYSPTDVAARELVRGLCRDLGLEVHEDALGNLFARWTGRRPELPAVATGSHTDAIPHAGMYDGTVGVLGGLAAVRALQAVGVTPERSVEVIMFTSEEPTRFGLGCLGSRAMCGALSPGQLTALRDADGRPLDELRTTAGFTGDLSGVRLAEGHYAAFVELHIEQGPILEREGLPIGVVTAIAAPAALRATFTGEGGHAGAVLMPQRHDALCAAAEVVLAVERSASGTGRIDTVGTVGVCRVHPGAINSVPASVTIEIDIRDTDLATRDRVVADAMTAARTACERRGVTLVIETLNADPPATCGDAVIAAAEAACVRLGLASRRMVSRAYHDSLFMARLCPTGMVFIPCRGGVSHRPDEYASPEAIRRGVEVLALTLAELAGT
jgi:ureidoglycolate amidohydrolase